VAVCRASEACIQLIGARPVVRADSRGGLIEDRDVRGHRGSTGDDEIVAENKDSDAVDCAISSRPSQSLALLHPARRLVRLAALVLVALSL